MSQLLFGSSKPTKSIGSIELGAVLGQGGFGKVILGYDTVRKQNVAVKFIDKKLVKEYNLSEYVDREIQMMKKLKHPFVVSLLSVTVSTKGHYLVMELAENGELFDRIVESKRFDEETARRYFQQLMSALIYCHGKGIVHRDLKAENLLLGKNNDLLICDFGLSRYVAVNSPDSHNDPTFNGDAKVTFKSLAGSVDYQAPEVIGEGGYQGFACDVWAAGVILFFMVCGYLPFSGKTENETHARIMKVEYNCDNNKYLSDSLKDLLKHIFVVNPKMRYTTSDIVAHPWFQEGSKSAYISSSSPLSTVTPVEEVSSPRPFPSRPSAGNLLRDNSNNNLIECENTMSNLEIDKLHAAFSCVDIDHSGYLTRIQVQDMLVKIREKPVSLRDVDEFVAKFDHDDQGRISEEQFIEGWTHNSELSSSSDVYRLINLFHHNLEKELLETLRKSFDEFIVFLDKNGVIPDSNFDVLVKSLDMTHVEGIQLRKMIENMKGKLTFDEFVSICTTRGLLTNNKAARRLRSVSKMFDQIEKPAFEIYINTGFTVTGMRETIAAKMQKSGGTINTVFTRGDIGESLIYGKHTKEGKGVLEVGIRLLPSLAGYTKVLAYRICGKTDVFHDWFRNIIKLFNEEILSFQKDTAPAGESELM
eukprot:Tbor_TRINITY_DN4729_c0_g1::TRINITY_DN4729_c0_g1_i1::g.16996::m.16996